MTNVLILHVSNAIRDVLQQTCVRRCQKSVICAASKTDVRVALIANAVGHRHWRAQSAGQVVVHHACLTSILAADVNLTVRHVLVDARVVPGDENERRIAVCANVGVCLVSLAVRNISGETRSGLEIVVRNASLAQILSADKHLAKGDILQNAGVTRRHQNVRR